LCRTKAVFGIYSGKEAEGGWIIMKILENLRWQPRNVTHLGCIKGCLDYLGMDVSEPWLYGGTGHAFVINICQDSV